MDAKKLVRIKDLHTWFYVEGRPAKAVDGVDFDIMEGEVLGIVGESGSGKSVSALSILRLIPDPPGKIVSGEIFFRDRNLLELPWEEMRKVRGNDISMIFQEPMTSLNPVFTIGMQVMEPIMHHQNVDRREACGMAIRLLEQVGISDASRRLWDYPHQFSGGMRQRVMIAMALACNPWLLIADEPTTALDVTIQAQILDLMMTLKERRPEAAVLLITHDLAVIAETCQRVIVMYCGRIQEISGVRDLFKNPLHPYTIGLMESIPSRDSRKKRLNAIPGNVPNIMNLPAGCSFSARCTRRLPVCETVMPQLIEVSPGHSVRCHLFAGGKP
ncbi:MAG: ABC transporter ATP-binding protein [Candidatus Wallbacteria bacterium]|nr:ABC transporter ATP-binding protein [Candidatus Wallbacteria bacterium]